MKEKKQFQQKKYAQPSIYIQGHSIRRGLPS